MRNIVYLALIVSGLATLPAVVQTPVRLSPKRQIRKSVDAWPLILSPRNDAERKINRYLSDLNVRLSRHLKACDSNYAQMVGNRNRSAADEEGAKLWRQNVKVTMQGPILLSILADTDFYCGGAHSYGYTNAAIFDLKAGEPADPLTWFNPSIKASLADQDDDGSAVEKSHVVAGLLKAYNDATHGECHDIFPADQSFLIWPDAKLGAVMIQADRLPGCCEACGIEVSLTLEQARKLGFSETFLQTVAEAHAKASF